MNTAVFSRLTVGKRLWKWLQMTKFNTNLKEKEAICLWALCCINIRFSCVYKCRFLIIHLHNIPQKNIILLSTAAAGTHKYRYLPTRLERNSSQEQQISFPESFCTWADGIPITLTEWYIFSVQCRHKTTVTSYRYIRSNCILVHTIATGSSSGKHRTD
jgi:hypothetical protein